MQVIISVIVAILVILFIGYKLSVKRDSSEIIVNETEILPYKIKDDFLTDAERSFYFALKAFVGDKVTICPKVGLKEIFFIGKGVGKNYMKYFGKIAQKHVDFILCETATMKLICAIELDDSSHTKPKGCERDLFVEKVYKDAGFELIRFMVKTGYSFVEFEAKLSRVLNMEKVIRDNNEIIGESLEVILSEACDSMPICPKCKTPMVLRKATRGEKAGTEFYGCVNYPNCKEIKNK